MVISKVEVKFSKNFPSGAGSGSALVNRRVLANIGRTMVADFRERVYRRGKHAKGRLPRYARGKWAWVPVGDPRFKGGKIRNVRNKKGEPKAPQRTFEGGYKDIKRAAGASPRSDGTLFGDLAASMVVIIKQDKRGPMIIVRHAKSSITSETKVQVSSLKTKRERTKTIRKRVRNRVKATALTTRTRSGRRTRQPQFALLRSTRRELRRYLKLAKRGLSVFK